MKAKKHSTKNLKELTKAIDAKGAFRITVTMDYIVPHYESRSLESIAKEWFEGDLYSSHAYRDTNKIGGSEKLIEYKIIPNEKSV